MMQDRRRGTGTLPSGDHQQVLPDAGPSRTSLAAMLYFEPLDTSRPDWRRRKEKLQRGFCHLRRRRAELYFFDVWESSRATSVKPQIRRLPGSVSKLRCRSRTGRFDIFYLRAAQAYMLISMPTGTSTIFGVFQVIRVSQVVWRVRAALNLGLRRT
jgi:hypothetical protein